MAFFLMSLVQKFYGGATVHSVLDNPIVELSLVVTAAPQGELYQS